MGIDRWRTWWAEPVSLGPLLVLRVVFGVLMATTAVRFLWRGWVTTLYVLPRYHFPYPGFSWVKPLPQAALHAIFILLIIAAIAITLGLFYRFHIITFFILFTYIELLDKATYLNHYYFISVLSFILIFLPLNHAYALDNWLGITPRHSHAPAGLVWSVRLLLAFVYFYAGLAKLNPDWLLEALPLRIWLRARTATPLLGPLFDQLWLAYAFSWAGMAFDLTIPAWLIWRKSRPYAYIVVIIFHLLTALLFNIGMFPFIMIGCTLIFFDWNLPHTATYHPPRLIHPILLGLLTIQLLLPLRHWLYPGDVGWTEEGGRFAWRVMLVEKTGQATFFVFNPATQTRWVVLPADYLTPQQVAQMSFQPDMIVQFAHFLEQEAEADVIVTAEVYVSYNGRSHRLLLDPTVDLTEKRPFSPPSPWILP